MALDKRTPGEIATVIAAMARSPEMIVPLIRETPRERLKQRPRPGKWSAHEHACHLAAVEPLFTQRLDHILTHPTPTIVPYNPGQDDEDGALLAMDLDSALLYFVNARAALVERLKRLTPDQWGKTAEHGEYSRYSIYIMFRHIAMHDLLHAYRIEEIALAKSWEPET